MRFILVIVLAMAPSAAGAQTFLIRGGLNFATQEWHTGGHKTRPKTLIGPHIGIGVTNTLFKKFSSQLEFGYTQLGHAGLSTGIGSTQTYSVPEDRESFLQATVLFKYNVDKHVNIHLGPQLGWFVGNRQNLGDQLFSVAGGLEIFPTKHFGFGVRYLHGITDINPDQQISQKSRVVQASINIRFNSHQLEEHGY